MDIETAFGTLNHSFLILVWKKFDFGQNFISWIETLIKDQKSCTTNGGKTTPYFNFHRGAHQCDPISAFLFILSLEVLLLSIKNNSEIQGIEIFNYCYLFSKNANNTTFFLKNKNFVGLVVGLLKFSLSFLV